MSATQHAYWNACNNLTTKVFSKHSHACFQQEQQIPAKSVFHWEEIQVFKKNTTRDDSLNPAYPHQAECVHRLVLHRGRQWWQLGGTRRLSCCWLSRDWFMVSVGCYSPLTTSRAAISLAHFSSVPPHACPGGQTLLVPPPRFPLLPSGGICRKL